MTILGPLTGLLGTLAVFLIFGLLSSITREACVCLGEAWPELEPELEDTVDLVLLGVILALTVLSPPPKLALLVRGAV